ncbi:MCE family protein [Nocardioides sp. GY 10113]|uniref:MCE family protein n=1 Tax=Nocardioides sp. GY 10113 TaxID=2569761 RepID=UPI0010A7DBE9|nr:MCE family protein [Nocardioides sp. GY 10113]TIC87926.1 MCE family protein [Nocardioides sp. GY 10113]
MSALRDRRLPIGLAALLLGVVLLQGSTLTAWLAGGRDGALVVTADFTDTTGLYVGNRVTYLGVPVGKVVEVQRRGTSMRAVLHLDPATRVPADAGAEIIQDALVTDRTIELGPAYTGGPTLADGGHIALDHTRSPANVDDVAASLDGLVRALSEGGGPGLGTLLSSTADTLRGNGAALRGALAGGEDALTVVNGEGEELTAVTADLARVIDLLAAREEQIRRLARGTRAATGVLADQREAMAATLTTLDRLARQADRLLSENGDVIGHDLAGLDDLVALVNEHRDSLGEAWDVMPTMAENYVRAYDWKLDRLRVQFALSVGPFSAVVRDHFCQLLAQDAPSGAQLCATLFEPDGTGLLDPWFDGIYDSIPGGGIP